MMKMTGKAFAKKLFGAGYERLPRTLFANLILFWGLYNAGFRVQVSPSVRNLMISAFTAGVMWQALSSKDNVVEMRHMLMLPFRRPEYVFSYVTVLGAYTLLTKTGLLLAVLLAVSVWKPVEIIGIVVCMIHSVLMAAAVYSLRKYWYAGGLWAAAIAAVILLFGSKPWLPLLLFVNGLFAVLLLWKADGYDFYREGLRTSGHGWLSGRRNKKEAYSWENEKSHRAKRRRPAFLWRYFFRYLSCHKNYLLNTAVMWCVALVLPYFLGEIAGLSVIAVGFAILSLNTPICILLSCDRDLEQAVRFLPGQKKAFCIPYCLFLFLCNMAADVIFLCSWQVQNGGVTGLAIAGAAFFALQSAVLSVLLEWFYPVRNWKIESDLWHHPRKYVVPVVMLLLAGAVSVWPALLLVLPVLLTVEIIILLSCFR
ncbi:MAG: hypothetical protein HFH05_15860 [Lachnospiraceae bacterium]|nr:hypothetical protein [Lachnospiraceae bacterium]